LAFGEDRASGSWKTRGSGQRLGDRAASEEGPKPRRGARESFNCFSGAWNVKTLKPEPKMAKGMRGASKQYRR